MGFWIPDFDFGGTSSKPLQIILHSPQLTVHFPHSELFAQDSGLFLTNRLFAITNREEDG
jgi:hypothetical protein